MKTEFFKPKNIQETLELLDRYQERAVIVNGGTDVVEAIEKGKKQPEVLIFIADIDELKTIRERDGQVEIGGAVTIWQALHDPITQKVSGLMHALRELGSPPIQRVATLAGNIGTGAPSADGTTMLMGLGTKIVVKNLHGERTIPLEEFFVKTYQTVLEPNELICSIYFPMPQAGDGSGYVRLARRKAQDIGKVLIGVSLTVQDGICQAATVGLGALNATAVRGVSTEQALIGLTKEAALKYTREQFPAEAGLRPSRFTDYKKRVTSVAVKRAVEKAWDDAEGGQ